MAIKLSEDERTHIERFVRPRKPTRRQKALALLGLAAGEAPETVARRVGIAEDSVLELADLFAERGLAGVGLEGDPEVVVTLIGPGGGTRKYRLPEGSTLDDLMRRTGASAALPAVSVDGIVPRKPLPLHHGAVVVVAPAPKDAAGGEPTPTAVPSLQDDDLFDQYRDILKARRKSRARDEGPVE